MTGTRLWAQEERLNPPEAITKAAEAYRLDQDRAVFDDDAGERASSASDVVAGEVDFALDEVHGVLRVHADRSPRGVSRCDALKGLNL